MAKRASYDWANILGAIPGYDPYRDSDGYEFDPATAAIALDFFPHFLTHVKGEKAGQPFDLELWEQAIIANLFGWKQKGTKYRGKLVRRYKESLVFVPRKNGKTALAAGICNLVLFTDEEPGAEIYSAAAEREQAALVFEQAAGMVNNSDTLSELARVYRKAITVEDMGSSYKAISADAGTKHGFNTHLAIIDELHAQRTPELVDVLLTSTGARRQPMIIHITTSDYERDNSICNRKHEYACKVRDGIISDPSFLPVIYEASRDDDWTDPAVWAKANPNLDVSIGHEYLERECQRAQDSPSYENTFKRLHLNIRTEQDVRWLAMPKWDACGRIDVDECVLSGLECFVGLDLASTTDIAALSLLFPPSFDEYYRLLMRFWIPSNNAYDREKRDRVPYTQWARDGFITMTEGDVIDYDVIRADINKLSEQYNIKEIAIDRWNAAQITTQLSGDGFDVVPFGQGFASMSAPTKEIEALVIGGKLGHGDNPVLRWMASNVSVEQDAAGNMKPSKKKSTEKIDGIVSTIMALGRAIVAEKKVASVYESRGVLQI